MAEQFAELEQQSRNTRLCSTIEKRIVGSLVAALDRWAESPPPDKYDQTYDLTVFGSPANLNIPIPNDPKIREAFSKSLGAPVDSSRVDDFLQMVWASSEK